MTYVYIDPAWNLDQSSYWPADKPIDNYDIGFNWANLADTSWCMDMDAGGVLSIRMVGMEPLDGTICVYRTDDVERLKEFQGLFCRLGYERDDDRLVEDGRIWVMSWIPMTGTLWQLSATTRIIHMWMTKRPMDEIRRECELMTYAVQTAAEVLYEKHGTQGGKS